MNIIIIHYFTTRAAPSSPTHPHRATLPYSHLTPQLRERLHFLWEPLGGSLISLAFNPLPLSIPSPHMADVRPRQELGEKLSGPGTPYSPPCGCLSERSWILRGTQSAATGIKSRGNELRGPSGAACSALPGYRELAAFSLGRLPSNLVFPLRARIWAARSPSA